MSNPAVSWILQLSVREGHLADLRALISDMTAATRADEPGCDVYEWFVSTDGKQCHIIERYRDAAAAMAHLAAFARHYSDRFFACLEPTSMTVYGDPGPEVRASLEPLGAVYFPLEGGFRRA